MQENAKVEPEPAQVGGRRQGGQSSEWASREDQQQTASVSMGER
jgi:hypothetical protein